MEHNFLELSLYFFTGLAAGVMNTLAGGGSMFVMAILLFTGVPSNMANGTNSLGILVQNFTGAVTFYRNGFLEVQKAVFYGIPSVIGAFVGSSVATLIPEHILDWVVSLLMLGALLFLIKGVLKGKKPPKASFKAKKRTSVQKILELLLFLAIGFQAGFVQAGMGVLLIILLTAFTSLSIIKVNAIKMVIIFFFSIPVFAVFTYNGLLIWSVAIMLAIGQVVGTWATSKFFLGNKKLTRFTDIIVIIVVILSIAKTLFW